jgi:hypothetical protein
MHKILHYQQWCFSRIRQEKFQGNPGNLLVFFTVWGAVYTVHMISYPRLLMCTYYLGEIVPLERNE